MSNQEYTAKGGTRFQVDGEQVWIDGSQARLADCLEFVRHVEGQEKHPAMSALESLTPGGSEFVNDVHACAFHIRQTREMQHELIKTFKRQRDEAQALTLSRRTEVLALMAATLLASNTSGGHAAVVQDAIQLLAAIEEGNKENQ